MKSRLPGHGGAASAPATIGYRGGSRHALIRHASIPCCGRLCEFGFLGSAYQFPWPPNSPKNSKQRSRNGCSSIVNARRLGRKGLAGQFVYFAAIQKLMEPHTAGDPISGLNWTHKTTQNVSDELRMVDIRVCARTVRRLRPARLAPRDRITVVEVNESGNHLHLSTAGDHWARYLTRCPKTRAVICFADVRTYNLTTN